MVRKLVVAVLLLSGIWLVSCGGGSGSATTYTVTSSGSHVTMNPSGAQSVAGGGTVAFTVTADTGYGLSTTVSGTCAAGSWTGNIYTTGTVTADCTVVFTATAGVYNVTSSGSHVTINPSSAQSVAEGGTVAFTVTADDGYGVLAAVTGTCVEGSWVGDVYTTGAVTADCTVIFTASEVVYTVTPSGANLTIDPAGAQSAAEGGTVGFTVTANSGYEFAKTIAGTCPLGNKTGDVYTTGAITGDCTVEFTATTTKKVFLTFLTYFGNLGGTPAAAITAADGYCNSDDYKPAGGGTYKAMIANSVRDKYNDWVFYPSTTYYQNDGITPIGTTTAGSIFEFPLTNFFLSIANSFWTGLNADWSVDTATCLNWTSNSGTQNGRLGYSATVEWWSIHNTLYACWNSNNLLCVEQ